MLIPDILHRSAAVRPERPAAWFDGSWRTYGELSAAAKRFAVFLRAEGIQPGDRVALLLDNSFDYIVAHFGALTAGAIEVSLNTELKSPDLKTLLADCEAVALVAGKKYAKQCAIGVRDKILGEAIKAFVAVRDVTLTEQQVREHLQRKLPPFKQPKHLEFTPRPA